MAVRDFIHRHYSAAVGSRPRVTRLPSWLLLIVVGVALVVSVVFIPAGIAVLGTLILGAGIFAHIMSPLKIGDWMDAVVGLSGAAITVTFVIAVIGIVAGFGVTVLVSLFRWLAG